MVAQNVAYEEFASGFVAPKAKILLVDDNEMNRRVFVELLKESRIQITEADSGAECLRLTKEHAYDLIFLDHMMPEMDGIETRRNMLSDEGNLCRQVPIVMLTANVTRGQGKSIWQRASVTFCQSLFSTINWKRCSLLTCQKIW